MLLCLVCLTLLASHLSFKNMYVYTHENGDTHTDLEGELSLFLHDVSVQNSGVLRETGADGQLVRIQLGLSEHHRAPMATTVHLHTHIVYMYIHVCEQLRR